MVAATIEIGSSQLSKLLGYPSSVHVRRPFLQNIYDTASNLLATNGVALGMGAACLLCMRTSFPIRARGARKISIPDMHDTN